MEMAVAKSVAQRLEEDNDVLHADVDRTGNEVTITATVPNKHAKRRVKSELHQYPLFIRLKIADD